MFQNPQQTAPVAQVPPNGCSCCGTNLKTTVPVGKVSQVFNTKCFVYCLTVILSSQQGRAKRTKMQPVFARHTPSLPLVESIISRFESSAKDETGKSSHICARGIPQSRGQSAITAVNFSCPVCVCGQVGLIFEVGRNGSFRWSVWFTAKAVKVNQKQPNDLPPPSPIKINQSERNCSICCGPVRNSTIQFILIRRGGEGFDQPFIAFVRKVKVLNH